MRWVTVFSLLLLTVSAAGSEPYGFGRILTLGRHDKLTHHESLQVLTAATVGFVFYQQWRKPVSYTHLTLPTAPYV